MSVLTTAMTEDELLQAVTQAMTLYGYRWTHSRRSDKALLMGHPGLADIIAVRNDRLLFVELKSEKGHPSTEQIRWSRALMEVAYHHGGSPETWLVKPSSLDTFLVYLR